MRRGVAGDAMAIACAPSETKARLSRLKRGDTRADVAHSRDEAQARPSAVLVRLRTSAVRGSCRLVPMRPRITVHDIATALTKLGFVFNQALKHIVAVRNCGPANLERVSHARLSIFCRFSRGGPARRNKRKSGRDWTK